MQIEVGSVTLNTTAYDKTMYVNDGTSEVRVIVHWDMHDGYELTWLDKEDRFITAPDWADEIDERDGSIGSFLDKLDAHSKVEL